MAVSDWDRSSQSMMMVKTNDSLAANLFAQDYALYIGHIVTNCRDMIKLNKFSRADAFIRTAYYGRANGAGFAHGIRLDANGNGVWAGVYNLRTGNMGWQVYQREAGVNTGLGGSSSVIAQTSFLSNTLFYLDTNFVGNTATVTLRNSSLTEMFTPGSVSNITILNAGQHGIGRNGMEEGYLSGRHVIIGPMTIGPPL